MQSRAGGRVRGLSFKSAARFCERGDDRGAYSWRQEDKTGSIAPGKIANFTALEEDPYAVKPIRLKDVPVWGTVFEGAVYPVERG
jgi:predicted amidohydrolase YtcJ